MDRSVPSPAGLAGECPPPYPVRRRADDGALALAALAAAAAWLAAVGQVPLVPVALGGFLETGVGTRFRLRVLAPLAPSAPAPDTPEGRRAARETTDALAMALAPAVADLETWSARANCRRPLPGLRRLFR